MCLKKTPVLMFIHMSGNEAEQADDRRKRLHRESPVPVDASGPGGPFYRAGAPHGHGNPIHPVAGAFPPCTYPRVPAPFLHGLEILGRTGTPAETWMLKKKADCII